jgi:prolyl-tRNA synthetase
VSRFLGLELHQVLKTLLVQGTNGGVVALCLRGDHELNVIKAERLPQVAVPLTFAGDSELAAATGATAGSVGPVGLKVPVIADRSAAHMVDFVCGANVSDAHLTGVNWGRDLPEPEVADLRNVTPGDPSPDGHGTLAIARGIEVGHVFQLGTKYSAAMGASVLDDNGDSHLIWMGCYGIGVSRIVAAAIEQNQDQRGILWPMAMAPFQVALVPIKMHKSERLREATSDLYQRLLKAGIETLLDDRDARPGVMFADMDLIGVPHRIVISERGLDAGQVEYKNRRELDAVSVPGGDIVEFLQQRIDASK